MRKMLRIEILLWKLKSSKEDVTPIIEIMN